MSKFNMTIGVSSLFALPFAISYGKDGDWEETTLAFFVGPFVIAFVWRWL
ncbi:hypothetical protein [Mesorhizobium sp.]|nr:hypothetical protein [Mesorhizobium sp.]